MTVEKDTKGNPIYNIDVNPNYKDPVVRCKVVFNCTSYCLDMQHGPDTSTLIVYEQWLDDKMVSSDTKQVTIVSNIRKKVLPKKRLRLDSDDDN